MYTPPYLTKKAQISILLLLLVLCSCQKTCDEFEPTITYFPHPCLIESRPSAFPEPGPDEVRTDWGKELRIGYAFAKEQDYYRAITGFKRALVLIPPKRIERRNQIEFCIIQSYYFAYKYQEAIEAFESSCLSNVNTEFPAFRDLLIMLYDSYVKTCHEDKAQQILNTLEANYPADAEKLKLNAAFIDVDFPSISALASVRDDRDDFDCFLADYCCTAKSVQKAEMLQTILPGAGYLYVDQKKSALTSFLINSLFIWGAYRFFEKGYTAAGIIMTSFEAGWYFGGINGAGMAAREYNERLYEKNAKEMLNCHGLFPMLMIKTSF